ncbi:conserved hypothetical protein [Ricinus communis]|uniref:Reverse transcriptase zinc-binding domain-containing protein n=1 Tax=Ricinus communis TaxID=3988 RepID=B9S0R5_RICCO|nr:conserved hypothetical protein [Ricinus communis]
MYEFRLWKPLTFSSHGPGLFHLLFADDTVLFEEATEEHMGIIIACLNEFFHASRQLVNFQKSSLFVSPNVDSGVVKKVSLMSSISLTMYLGMYLGALSIHGRVSNNALQFLIDRTCQIPYGVINGMRSYVEILFREQIMNKRGLVLFDGRKWLSPNSWWVRDSGFEKVIRNKYMKGGRDINCPRKNQITSSIWRGIQAGAPLVSKGRGWDWGKLNGILPIDIGQRLAAFLLSEDSGAQDGEIWKFSKNSDFFIKTAYVALHHVGLRKNARVWKLVWRVVVPQGICMYLWLIVQDKILSNTERVKKDFCGILTLILRDHQQALFGSARTLVPEFHFYANQDREKEVSSLGAFTVDSLSYQKAWFIKAYAIEVERAWNNCSSVVPGSKVVMRLIGWIAPPLNCIRNMSGCSERNPGRAAGGGRFMIIVVIG